MKIYKITTEEEKQFLADENRIKDWKQFIRWEEIKTSEISNEELNKIIAYFGDNKIIRGRINKLN